MGGVPTLWKSLLDEVWPAVRRGPRSRRRNVIALQGRRSDVEVGVEVAGPSRHRPGRRVEPPRGSRGDDDHRGSYAELGATHEAVVEWSDSHGLATARSALRRSTATGATTRNRRWTCTTSCADSSAPRSHCARRRGVDPAQRRTGSPDTAECLLFLSHLSKWLTIGRHGDVLDATPLLPRAARVMSRAPWMKAADAGIQKSAMTTPRTIPGMSSLRHTVIGTADARPMNVP